MIPFSIKLKIVRYGFVLNHSMDATMSDTDVLLLRLPEIANTSDVSQCPVLPVLTLTLF